MYETAGGLKVNIMVFPTAQMDLQMDFVLTQQCEDWKLQCLHDFGAGVQVLPFSCTINS